MLSAGNVKRVQMMVWRYMSRAGLFVATVALAGAWPATVPAMPDRSQVRLAQAEIGEAELWERAAAGNERAMLEMYLRVFPDGAHAAEARARLDGLPAPGEAAARAYRPDEKGWLGVEVKAVELSPEQAAESGRTNGIDVVRVLGFGPAARAGLRQGDVIVAVDGAAIGELRAFVADIAGREPTSPLHLSVLRDGGMVELTVTLGGRITDSLAAAEAGDADAQLQVGFAYATGNGVEKDEKKGFEWYMKAAGQGNVQALYNIGNAYFYGRGVAKDQATATPYYYTAARQGHAGAQTHTGYAYAKGIGVPQDDAMAVEWYRKAADQNEPYALNNLATYYNSGTGGVRRDRNRAIELMRRSAAMGNELALKNLEQSGVPPFDPAELQRALADLGFDPGPVDGKIGRKTREAVRAAQKALGLKEDGEATLELFKSLRAAAARGGLNAPAN